MILIKFATFCFLPTVSLSAGPINVFYTLNGSPGDWTLDFSVNNNIAGAPNQEFYFFGVELMSGSSFNNISGSPASFNGAIPYNPSSGLGGPDITYNDVWVISTFPNLGTAAPGTTTSGFDVTITDTGVPTSVNWFALTDGSDPYSGGGNLDTIEPGDVPLLFEGSAGQTGATPEPSTLWLIGAGLAGIGALTKSFGDIRRASRREGPASGREYIRSHYSPRTPNPDRRS
jgi:PEP-CTERM motif